MNNDQNAGKLIAHCDTKRVSEEIVKSAISPDFTKSWHPFSHKIIIEMAEKAAENSGALDLISDRSYSLSKDQQNMFAVWNIKSNNDQGINTAIGFRNSMSKMLSVGFTAGTRVFVCDNMAFSGDWITFHKHSSTLDPLKLADLCKRAFDTIKDKMESFLQWHLSLGEIKMCDKSMKIMTFEAMKQKVLPPSKFESFVELYDKNTNTYGSTVRSWFEANTELQRNNSFAGQNISRNTIISDFVAEISNNKEIVYN